ncbi:MAG: hypothetical protein R3Y28_08730 [Candidatus Gastranaerophilales bacterium]
MASLIVLLVFCERYKSGELQNEFIPRLKYTLTDINLLFPTNDYQKERRYMLWNQKVYLRLLDKLKSVEDGYVVSEADLENEDASNPFSDLNNIFHSKNTKNILDLLMYGDLTETQKQAILDFYKMKDEIFYEIARDIYEIKSPKSLKDFAQVQEKIKRLIPDSGSPGWYYEWRQERNAEKYE